MQCACGWQKNSRSLAEGARLEAELAMSYGDMALTLHAVADEAMKMASVSFSIMSFRWDL